jgi:DNA-binding transcriptional LysR family regulator
VRLPRSVRATLARLLHLPPGDALALALALECDDVETLKRVALATDTVLAAPDASVATLVEQGGLVHLPLTGLPPLFAEMGVVTLRGRTPSPMAETIVARLPWMDRHDAADGTSVS